MQSTALKISAFVLALAASAGTFAATQGTAGATSTGAYTNTLGNIPAPQVRVFGLSDSNLNSSSTTSTANPWAQPYYTSSDQFCVAHSTGGNVRLTFSSAGLTNVNNIGLIATNSATGQTTEYHQLVYKTGSSSGGSALLSSTRNTIDIQSAQSDLNTCSAPNVTKAILLQGGGAWPLSNTGVYTDVMTVTASPI